MKLLSLLHSKSLMVNSILVYAQRFGTGLLALVSTPIILNQLGVVDYGIYTLTIGVIALINFVNWSLSQGTQRYIAYSIGSDKNGDVQRVFMTSMFIHLIYAVLLMLVVIVVALFFATALLNIPENRINATQYVLIIVGLISFNKLITIPFIGMLRAYENFFILSIYGLSSSVLKLVAALLLVFIPFDNLITFATLIAFFELLLAITIVIYCWRQYDAVNIQISNISKTLFKDMLGFMSWSLIGALALLGRNQGISVVLNLFFGIVVNAAYGIALQIQNAVGMLAQGFSSSMSPRIMKSAGKQSISEMTYYMEAMARFSFLSVSLFAILYLFNSEVILNLWLNTVPEDTVIFSQLVVLFVLISTISAGIQTAFQALGRMKLYNIWVSTILILNLPIGVMVFWMGFPAYSILIIGVGLELLAFVLRIRLLKKYLDFSITNYISNLFRRLFLPVTLISISLWLISLLISNPIWKLLVHSSVVLLIYPLIIYRFSLASNEQLRLANLIRAKIPVLR